MVDWILHSVAITETTVEPSEGHEKGSSSRTWDREPFFQMLGKEEGLEEFLFGSFFNRYGFIERRLEMKASPNVTIQRFNLFQTVLQSRFVQKLKGENRERFANTFRRGFTVR